MPHLLVIKKVSRVYGRNYKLRKLEVKKAERTIFKTVVHQL